MPTGTLKEMFETAVDKGDLLAIKSHLTTYFNKNPTDQQKEVSKAFNYARDKMPEFIEPHDGGSFVLDEREWDLDYLAKLFAELIYNFSEERFKHTLNVSSFLHKDKFPVDYIGKKDPDCDSDKPNLTKVVVGCIILGVVLAGLFTLVSVLGEKDEGKKVSENSSPKGSPSPSKTPK